MRIAISAISGRGMETGGDNVNTVHIYEIFKKIKQSKEYQSVRAYFKASLPVYPSLISSSLWARLRYSFNLECPPRHVYVLRAIGR